MTVDPHVVLATAAEEWHRGIVEGTRAGDERIKHYFLTCGWGWFRRLAARIVGRKAWCGAFAGYCWVLAGLPDWLAQRNVVSTYRLDRWCNECGAVRVPLDQLQPGDILVVGSRKSYGDHITIVRDVLDVGRCWATIEGNANGRLPGGHEAHGVVRRERHRREARYGVRAKGL